jgi:hypothetical protein
MIHHEFVPEKHTLNDRFYKGVIKRLIDRVRVRFEFQEHGSWHLLHDNAPMHSLGIISDLLVKQGIPVLSHPAYSLDLSPADLILFPNLKTAMKGMRFEAVFIDPTDCDERTVGDTRRSAFLGIQFIV